MSVVSNPLIGATKQKMGNVVFSTWKGINVLKNKASSVANPKTDRQKQQRSAMAQIVFMFRHIPSVVDAGFKKLAVKMSPYNAFASYNLKNAFNFAVPPAATLVPANVLISKGTIAPQPATMPAISKATGEIVFMWDSSNPQPGQSINDLAIIAAFNSTKNEWIGATTETPRENEGANLTLPTNWVVGDSITGYLGFYNLESGKSSDSVNATGAIVA